MTEGTSWVWLAVLGAGLTSALLVYCLAAFWRWGQVPRQGRLAPKGAMQPWWWVVSLGAVFLQRLPYLQVKPALRRELQDRLRRADLARELGADDLRAMQLGLSLLALLGLALLLLQQERGLEVLLAPGVWLPGLGLGLLAWAWPLWWLRTRAGRRRRAVGRALPFTLDMLTLSLEGGLHFQGAVQQVVDKGPAGPLQDELREWLGEIRAGATRAEALRTLAQRLDEPAVRSWVQLMLQADGLGMSLGPILRAQAEQRRQERFLLAEKRALQAPVKMLFPLIACIFPCTFLVLGFPIAMYWMELAL